MIQKNNKKLQKKIDHSISIVGYRRKKKARKPPRVGEKGTLLVLFLLGVFILKHGKPGETKRRRVYKNWCGIDEGLFYSRLCLLGQNAAVEAGLRCVRDYFSDCFSLLRQSLFLV